AVPPFYAGEALLDAGKRLISHRFASVNSAVVGSSVTDPVNSRASGSTRLETSCSIPAGHTPSASARSEYSAIAFLDHRPLSALTSRYSGGRRTGKIAQIRSSP